MGGGVNGRENGTSFLGDAQTEGRDRRSIDSQGSVVGNTGLAVNPILALDTSHLRPTHYSLGHKLRHNLGMCHKARLGYHCRGYSEC